MKKIILSFLIALLFLGEMKAQPTIYFRMNDPELITAGTYLHFTVQMKANVDGYYMHAGSVNIDLGTAAMNLATSSASNFVGGFTNGTYPGPPPFFTPVNKYNAATVTINGGRLNIAYTATYLTPPADPLQFGTYYNEVTTTWQDLFDVYMAISSTSLEAGLTFNHAFMDLGQVYCVPSNVAVANPTVYHEEMSNLLLGKIYDDNYGWTLSDPDAGDGTLFVSVWSGTAPITAVQATPAAIDDFRLHKHTTLGSIPSGYLSIEPGAGLTVLGTLISQEPESVTIQSDATGTGSLIVSAVVGGGTYAVERFFSASGASEDNYYFHQVAAPVDNILLGDWNMVPGQSYAFEYNGVSAAWDNIYNPARSTVLGYGFILSKIQSGGDETVTFVDDILITDKTGYSIFDGVGEYTLLGNPYTSPISWDAFHASQGAGANLAAAVHIWSEAAANYVDYVTGVGGNASCQFIQVGQAFFVQNANGAATVDFRTTHRVHNDQAYLKDEPVNIMRLYTIGGNETSDGLYIKFMEAEGVTAGFDMQFDSENWPSAYANIATEINTTGSDGSMLSIDVRPPIEDNLISIPVAFKAGVDANYSFGTEMIESFHAGVDIMLEDKSFPGAEWFNMREGNNYEFTAAPGDPNDRFVLHFFDQTFGIDDKEISPITIYSYRTDAFIVNNTEQLIKEVLVYDMMGSLILDKVEVNASPLKIYVSDKVGYYVVKVITDKAVYSEKVYITN